MIQLFKKWLMSFAIFAQFELNRILLFKQDSIVYLFHGFKHKGLERCLILFQQSLDSFSELVCAYCPLCFINSICCTEFPAHSNYKVWHINNWLFCSWMLLCKLCCIFHILSRYLLPRPTLFILKSSSSKLSCSSTGMPRPNILFTHRYSHLWSKRKIAVCK